MDSLFFFKKNINGYIEHYTVSARHFLLWWSFCKYIYLRHTRMLIEKLVSDVKHNPALGPVYKATCLYSEDDWKYTTRLWREIDTYRRTTRLYDSINTLCLYAYLLTCIHLQLYGWWEAAEQWAEALFASALHSACEAWWSVLAATPKLGPADKDMSSLATYKIIYFLNILRYHVSSGTVAGWNGRSQCKGPVQWIIDEPSKC